MLFTRIFVCMRLKTARKLAGLTQAQLAKRAGVGQQIISKIESGLIANPSYRTVVCICRALNVHPFDITEFQIRD